MRGGSSLTSHVFMVSCLISQGETFTFNATSHMYGQRSQTVRFQAFRLPLCEELFLLTIKPQIKISVGNNRPIFSSQVKKKHKAMSNLTRPANKNDIV
jgi:hypothetical protein